MLVDTACPNVGQSPRDDDVSVSLENALMDLLGRPPGPDHVTDLLAAGAEAMRRRERNTELGEVVFAAIGEVVTEFDDLSWRDVERATGAKKSTAQRWGTRPGRTEQ